MRCSLFVDGVGSSREDDGCEVVRCEFFDGYEAGVELAVYVHFTDAACDEVGVLRSKVQDGDLGSILEDGEGEKEGGGEYVGMSE